MIYRLPTTLRADASGGKAPKWQQLFPLGTFHNGGWPAGGVTITAATCATMIANWKKRGSPALPVDYLHRGADLSLPVEQQAASGWIEALEQRPDGTMWAQITWTAKAKALIAADEFRFLSPEFRLNDIDSATGERQGPTLIGAGLVNRPAFKEMPRIAAAAVPLDAQAHPGTEKHMEKILAAALAALGLKSDATEADVVARGALLASEKAKADESLKAAAAPLEAKVTALTAAFESLKAANTELVTNAKKAAVDGLVAELQNDGKGNVRIIAAQVEGVRLMAGAIGVDAARTHFMAGPIIKKLGEQGYAGTDAAESAEGAYKKLQAAATELVKAGVPSGDALIRAMELNPELTKAAASLTSPRS